VHNLISKKTDNDLNSKSGEITFVGAINNISE